MDKVICWISSTVYFIDTYMLCSDLSFGWCDSPFEQPGPGHFAMANWGQSQIKSFFYKHFGIYWIALFALKPQLIFAIASRYTEYHSFFSCSWVHFIIWYLSGNLYTRILNIVFQMYNQQRLEMVLQKSEWTSTYY